MVQSIMISQDQQKRKATLNATPLWNHQKKGGVIRLWPDVEVTIGLALAEGIETALSAAIAFTPIWSTVDKDNLSDFAF